jgi:four helix bundle protein
LAIECYRLTREFPKEERYALSSQLRRAAASITANIAEGFGRGTQADFIRYLFFARGSLFETESHLRLARDVGHVTEAKIAHAMQLREIAGRTLNALIARIRARLKLHEETRRRRLVSGV